MRTSALGRKLITQHEGEVLKVYKDPVGLPTVGVGHLVKQNERKQYPVGKVITKAESQKLLAQDLHTSEIAVEDAVTAPINQNQFDALVSLTFNIGVAAFKRSSVRKRLNALNYEGAADAFLVWNKADNKVLAGLTKRREAERDLFLEPISAAEIKPLPLASIVPSDGLPKQEPVETFPPQREPFIDRLTAPLLNAREKFSQLGVDPSTISKSSAVTTIVTKIIAGPQSYTASSPSNPHYLLAGSCSLLPQSAFSPRRRNATLRSIHA
jgi:lysozyme